MPPSTRDLLASVLGELPPAVTAPACPPPHLSSPQQKVPQSGPGLWRVTAKVSGGKVQISNHQESRVVPKEQVELYLRGHGPRSLACR